MEFRRDTDFMDERLSGNTVLELLARGGPSRAASPIPGSLPTSRISPSGSANNPPCATCRSITDTFRQLNKSMHGDNEEAYRIPETRELAAQYLLL